MILDIPLPAHVQIEIERLVSIIASEAAVKTIILFGSTARGTRLPESDIDLLILLDSYSVDHSQFSSRIRQQAMGKISFPMDLVVESIHDYQERSLLPTLERKIAREGKILYAA